MGNPTEKPLAESIACTGKILFVDDEKNILNSVRRELMETGIEVFCAQGGTDGLQILEKQPIDIVISDYRMPEMDGYQFLTTVKETYPQVNRVILSGFLDQKLLIRAISSGLATTYFTKPWDKDVLLQKISHLLQMRVILKNKTLLETINTIEKLPTISSLFQKMCQAVEARHPAREIAELLENDPAIAAKILQVANSAFMGTKKVSSIKDALGLLGLESVKDILLAVTLMNENHLAKEFIFDYELNFLKIGLINYFLPLFYKLIYKKELTANFPSIGLMHNIGMLIIISQLPERYRKVLGDQARHPEISFYETELALGYEGCTHAEIGGYFLDLWSLPAVLIEAALFHHDPTQASPENRALITATVYTEKLIDYLWKTRRASKHDLSAFYIKQTDQAALEELFEEVLSALKNYSSSTYRAIHKSDFEQASRGLTPE
jgi:HD-like signal output (HDOD) protein